MHRTEKKGYTADTPFCAAAQNGKMIQKWSYVIMEQKKKNTNIKCTVTQCKHNMVTENYCGLDCICVGTHETNPTVPECTDCCSFVKRSGTDLG